MCDKSKGSNKIRTGDKVIVITGNYAGQTGTVMKAKEGKVVVQGINIVKKHVKKTQDKPQGAIISFEKPIPASNVMLCIGNDKPVKLKVKKDHEGNRYLYYRDGEQEVIHRYIRTCSKSSIG